MQLANGAHVEQSDSDGFTLLHHAVRLGHTQMTRLLLEQGANVNAETNSKKKPADEADNVYESLKIKLQQGDTAANGTE